MNNSNNNHDNHHDNKAVLTCIKSLTSLNTSCFREHISSEKIIRLEMIETRFNQYSSLTLTFIIQEESYQNDNKNSDLPLMDI